jgi:methionyl-tRNA formyltransferase
LPLRLVFMGTPDFAVPTLLEIADQHEIVAAFTRAPRPAGRGLAPQQSPIAREAARLGIPIFTPKMLKDATAASTIGALNANAAVVVAYGLILPKAILDCFPLG